MQRTQNSRRRLAVLACLAVASPSVSTVATAACVDPNTCYGTGALDSNTSGVNNAGFGFQALLSNTEGSLNTAVGYAALSQNTSGNDNTATGYAALSQNTTANHNTAAGFLSLGSNTTGGNNTASGSQAIASNVNGRDNTATGYAALIQNESGRSNTANGGRALANATGSRNVALGYNAGYSITSGTYNIMIGAGQKGRATDSGVIRIGTTAQTKTLIAGIRGVTTGLANAVPVVIDQNGQLGTISSSRRFKEDIQPMGSASERLRDLRPVTFRYKQPYDDGSTPVQFGLVAEEVAAVFPELVVYGEDGEPETVSYHLLPTLLLNEVQQDRRVIDTQNARIAALEKQVAELAALLQAPQ